MQRIMLKGKIYNVKVTDANLHYQGSITIDSDLLKKADILEYEQVHVLNITNGQRFETYAIKGNLGEICVNGAAAKLVEIGDELIILSYGIINSPQLYPSPPDNELKYMEGAKVYPKIIKGK